MCEFSIDKLLVPMRDFSWDTTAFAVKQHFVYSDVTLRCAHAPIDGESIRHSRASIGPQAPEIHAGKVEKRALS